MHKRDNMYILVNIFEIICICLSYTWMQRLKLKLKFALLFLPVSEQWLQHNYM